MVEPAREFEPTYETIRKRVHRADRDEGRCDEGLSTEELRQLWRENRQLRLEQDILAKATACRNLHIYERSPGLLSGYHDGSSARACLQSLS